MKRKKFVYICSPCKGHDGNREHNIIMAQEYCRLTMQIWPDVVPLAPHVYFTQFLDDSCKHERIMGMEAGIALLSLCSELWVFGMKNPSEGMKREIEYAREHDIAVIDAERYEVAQIVTAEAEGEPLAGKIAICQCILQAREDDGIRPAEAAAKYLYTKKRPEPTDESLTAVNYVFDFGMVATTKPIKYFKNPELTTNTWHETQTYIMTINNHRFYAEKK